MHFIICSLCCILHFLFPAFRLLKCQWKDDIEVNFKERTALARKSLQARAVLCVRLAQTCFKDSGNRDKYGRRKLDSLLKQLLSSKAARDKGPSEQTSSVKLDAAIGFIERTKRRLSIEPELRQSYAVVAKVLRILHVE